MSNVKHNKGRNETREELQEFVLFLVDEENCFTANLETLLNLEKSPNNEVLSFIKKIFHQKFKAIVFTKRNEEKFWAKDGTVSKYELLDTSIAKSRRK